MDSLTNHQDHETTVDDILEFLRDHMVMKEDFEREIGIIHNEMGSMKQDIGSMKQEMALLKDRIDNLEARIDHGFVRIYQELDDIRKQIVALEQKTQEDADAVVKEIIKLTARVDALERGLHAIQMVRV